MATEGIEKICPICGKSFVSHKNGYSRKYCYDCSPNYEDDISRAESLSVLRRAMKKAAVNLHGGKCEICGYNKCLAALQFHHLNPEEKSFALSQNTIHSWEEYFAESQKCILVCANCHAEIHNIKT